ncbi:hypothetical protein KFL_002320010, partial [Klebsormidium nitens]
VHTFGQPFTLLGNRDDKSGGASVVNGFSKDALAAAWNVDEPTVEKLPTSQKGAFIIKLEDKERARGPAPRAAATWPFGDVSFNLEETQPEIVTKGGSLNFVNEFKMPVLKKVGMSAACVKLKANAIFAPGWSPNAHHVVYFTRGKGRIQVAAPGGKSELDREVSAGQLVIIPKHFPATKLAARESPLEWVTVMTSPAPVSSFLAGAHSVYKAFPFDWLVAGFDVDPELEKKVLRAQTEESIILTRQEKSADVSGQPNESGEEHAAASFDEAVEDIFG